MLGGGFFGTEIGIPFALFSSFTWAPSLFLTEIGCDFKLKALKLEGKLFAEEEGGGRFGV